MILNFRHLLEKHALGQALFDEMTAILASRGLLLRQGTIVDATLIASPPSTKNRTRKRDPEMEQAKKGKMVFRDESAYWSGCDIRLFFVWQT